MLFNSMLTLLYASVLRPGSYENASLSGVLSAGKETFEQLARQSLSANRAKVMLTVSNISVFLSLH